MKNREELNRMTINDLIQERVFVPNYNARYLEHLESLAIDDKSYEMKKSAIKSLVSLVEDDEYNNKINEVIIAKRNLPSIFGPS